MGPDLTIEEFPVNIPETPMILGGIYA